MLLDNRLGEQPAFRSALRLAYFTMPKDAEAAAANLNGRKPAYAGRMRVGAHEDCSEASQDNLIFIGPAEAPKHPPRCGCTGRQVTY